MPFRFSCISLEVLPLYAVNFSRGLRNVLNGQTQAQIILDFGDAPVFDATTYPCIVLLNKDRPVPDHIYRGLTADNHIDLEKIAPIFDSMAQTLPQVQGVQPPAGSSSASALIQKLMGMGTPLGQYADSKLCYGIKTGLNEAFVVDQATRDRLTLENPRSVEVLKPFLRGRDLGRYSIRPAGLWLIYTYHGIDIKPYPAIEAYLKPFKEALENRATKQAWYELQQPQKAYQNGFEGPKIVYPDIAACTSK